jgi:HAD superfamily hydrolase (TIGR01509 family)
MADRPVDDKSSDTLVVVPGEGLWTGSSTLPHLHHLPSCPRRGAAAYRCSMPALQELPRPSAVVFDLDGTLVDTVEIRIEAWRQALGDAGFPTTREQLGPLIGVDGKRLAHEIAAAAGRPIDDRRAEEIDKACGEVFEGLNTDPRPLPGVRALVSALEEQGSRWGIATSSRREQVARSVNALELPREPAIIDGSRVEHAKPEPDLLLLAARELQVDPARCWYVGDSTWDMVSAVAAGMIAVGVTAGSAVDMQALTGAGAQLVVERLDDLVPLLASGRGSLQRERGAAATPPRGG